jgi:hypothetical protein
VSIWNGHQWEVVPGAPNDVIALASEGSLLYVGCRGQNSALHVWDGRRLRVPGSGIGRSAVTTLVAEHGTLLVGGSFRRAGDVAAWGVAEWFGPVSRRPRVPTPFDAIIATPNPSRRGQPLELDAPLTNVEPIDEAPHALEFDIHDLSGRRLRSIAALPGVRVIWDGRDARGREVPEGVYFIRTKYGTGQTAIRRIVRLP